ncbi:uncharacterized protein LOC129746952 [Uranotaenia lowii]|uniref:uncharacterized protein LOC129746952 n=1 Tax=Uranotaenia lowii TaxID=190385 RepID=UPI002479EDE4|nr:uncharacterized protein LOC129746952 [Uranotaenia lowii]
MSKNVPILEKLMRSASLASTSRLISEQEYKQLISVPFEDFLNANYTTEQLNRLCLAEKLQLQLHYEDLEKKSKRIVKRIRVKPIPKLDKPRARFVPAPPEKTTEPIVEPQVIDIEPVSTVRQIDESLAQESVNEQISPPEEAGTSRNIVAPNEPINSVDLSDCLLPREMLIPEITVESSITGEQELDLGPPGDASAFFGSNEPLSIERPEVRRRIIKEFPSIRQFDRQGRFEDLNLDSESGPQTSDSGGHFVPPLPPVAGTRGFSSSTPLAVPPGTFVTIRRPFLNPSALDGTDLSAIRNPPSVEKQVPELMDQDTQVSTTQVEQEVDISTIQNMDVSQDPASTAVIDACIEEQVVTENTVPQVSIVEEPRRSVRIAPAESTSSSESSIDRRPRRVPKNIRKVPVYGNSRTFLNLQHRKNFDMFDDDFEVFETFGELIGSMYSNRIAVQQPKAPDLEIRNVEEQSLVVPDLEQQPVLRDQSNVVHDMNSLRDVNLSVFNRSKLYPIRENQKEDNSVLPNQMTEKDIPVERLSILPLEDLLPPEIPLRQTSGEAQRSDTGLGQNTLTFGDNSSLQTISLQPLTLASSADKSLESNVVEVSTRQIVQEPNNTAGLKTSAPTVEQPYFRTPEFIPPVEPSFTQHVAAHKELFDLYCSIHHRVSCTKKNTLLIPELLVLIDVRNSRLATCRTIMQLIKLRTMGYIETGLDEQLKIRSVSLRGRM